MPAKSFLVFSKKDHATTGTVLADIETTRKDIKGKNKTAELLARQFDDLLKDQKPFFFKVQLQAREDLMGKIASAVSDVRMHRPTPKTRRRKPLRRCPVRLLAPIDGQTATNSLSKLHR